MGGTLTIFDDIHLTSPQCLGGAVRNHPVKLSVGEGDFLFCSSLWLSGWYQRCKPGYRLAVVLASLADVAERLSQPCPVYFGKRLLVPSEQAMPDDFFLLLVPELDRAAHEYVRDDNDALMLYVWLINFREALGPLNLSPRLTMAFDLFLRSDIFAEASAAVRLSSMNHESNQQLSEAAKKWFCCEALISTY